MSVAADTVIVGPGRPGFKEGDVRVVTVDELDKMTPAERERTFQDSIIRDLDDVPEQYRSALEAQRARVLEREARLRGNAS